MAESLEDSIRVRLTEGLRESFFGVLEGKDHGTRAALLESEGMDALIHGSRCEGAGSVQDKVKSIVRDLEEATEGTGSDFACRSDTGIDERMQELVE